MIWNGGDKCNFAFAQIVFEFFFAKLWWVVAKVDGKVLLFQRCNEKTGRQIQPAALSD